MPFHEESSYTNDDANHRVDLLSLAHMELADADLLVDQAGSSADSRWVRLCLEATVNKISSAFQLFMRGCEYVEAGGRGSGDSGEALADKASKLLKDATSSFSKAGGTSLGRVANWRQALFHEGSHFLDQRVDNPVATVQGRGFVAVRVSGSGRWDIRNYRSFAATAEEEWALTSDGVYRILNPGTPTERWNTVPDASTTIFMADQEIFGLLEEAQEQVAGLLHELGLLMQEGIDGTPIAFLNEGGNAQIKDGDLLYDLGDGRRLNITGVVTTDLPQPPPSHVPGQDQPSHPPGGS